MADLRTSHNGFVHNLFNTHKKKSLYKTRWGSSYKLTGIMVPSYYVKSGMELIYSEKELSICHMR